MLQQVGSEKEDRWGALRNGGHKITIAMPSGSQAGDEAVWFFLSPNENKLQENKRFFTFPGVVWEIDKKIMVFTCFFVIFSPS